MREQGPSASGNGLHHDERLHELHWKAREDLFGCMGMAMCLGVTMCMGEAM